MPEMHRLPNGDHTPDDEEYVTAWRGIARTFAEIMGGKAFAYDPGVSISVRGRSYDYDISEIRCILQEHFQQQLAPKMFALTVRMMAIRNEIIGSGYQEIALKEALDEFLGSLTEGERQLFAVAQSLDFEPSASNNSLVHK